MAATNNILRIRSSSQSVPYAKPKELGSYVPIAGIDLSLSACLAPTSQAVLRTGSECCRYRRLRNLQ